jgi:hypothetical protein
MSLRHHPKLDGALVALMARAAIISMPIHRMMAASPRHHPMDGRRIDGAGGAFAPQGTVSKRVRQNLGGVRA